MPNFIYKVRDKDGRERQNTQEAASEEELITRLQHEGLVILALTPQKTAQKTAAPASIKRRLHLKATSDDMIVFARQLATMLEAGVTLLKSLEVLSRQIESKILSEVVEQLKNDIAAGSTFGDALTKHPKIFSQFWVHVVETGEASGTLPVSLAQLADYLESSAELRRKIGSALLYPAILMFIAMAALSVFTLWIIPIFSRVFDSFDVQLPLLTNAVLTFSEITRRYFLLFFAGLAGLVYFTLRYIKTERGKWQFDRFILNIPVLAPLFQRIAIERFASGLGALIESGVPILYALDIVGKAVENKVMERAIVEVRESVRRGKGMAGPMEKNAVFTPMVVQMVAVGEEIGELSQMLNKVSRFYKERIAATLNKITTLIEPTVLVFMGLVVGILVVSMFLPIFQLATVSHTM